jgi:protein-S-isoprenylcysteine O-methyltransferase Ste14
MLKLVSRTFSFCLFMLLWNVCCSLPYLLGMSSMTKNGHPLFLKAGRGTLFLVGLMIETLADAQKWFFKQSNPGQFCNVGLWSISQHPNFFGNLVLWAGIFLVNVPALIDPTPSSDGSIWRKMWSYRRLLLALISPIFMWNLFSGQEQGSSSWMHEKRSPIHLYLNRERPDEINVLGCGNLVTRREQGSSNPGAASVLDMILELILSVVLRLQIDREPLNTPDASLLSAPG